MTNHEEMFRGRGRGQDRGVSVVWLWSSLVGTEFWVVSFPQPGNGHNLALESVEVWHSL